MLYTIILVLAIIVAVLLVLVILAQPPKTSGGLSSNLGGGGSNQNVAGVKRGLDLIEKITWGLATTLLILTLSSRFFITRSVDTSLDNIKTNTINTGQQKVKTSDDVKQNSTKPAEGKKEDK